MELCQIYISLRLYLSEVNNLCWNSTDCKSEHITKTDYVQHVLPGIRLTNLLTVLLHQNSAGATFTYWKENSWMQYLALSRGPKRSVKEGKRLEKEWSYSIRKIFAVILEDQIYGNLLKSKMCYFKRGWVERWLLTIQNDFQFAYRTERGLKKGD